MLFNSLVLSVGVIFTGLCHEVQLVLSNLSKAMSGSSLHLMLECPEGVATEGIPSKKEQIQSDWSLCLNSDKILATMWQQNSKNGSQLSLK